jgi:hypothetical protein
MIVLATGVDNSKIPAEGFYVYGVLYTFYAYGIGAFMIVLIIGCYLFTLRIYSRHNNKIKR